VPGAVTVTLEPGRVTVVAAAVEVMVVVFAEVYVNP
jgi:hypothetical protein